MFASSRFQAFYLVVVLFIPSMALSHPGGLDSYGCHNETATGTYHCHSGPFDGRSFPSKDAMLAELATNNPPNPNPDTPPTTIPAYDRDLYSHWIDADGDCQDARQEVLIIESLIPVTLSADGCRVEVGQWFDPFTGLTFTNPSDLDIDHMVPLEETHNSGGHAWDSARKRTYANDLLLSKSLIAVSASANRSKGSRDPANWLPTNLAHQCDYVKNWMEVKRRHGLDTDAQERAAIEAVLGASIEMAARAESAGWDEIAQKNSSAVFGLGVKLANQCAYTRSPLSTDHMQVSVSILPDPAHINQSFNIFLVAELNGGLYSLDALGQFIPFTGDVRTLVPFQSGIILRQSHEFTVFDGVLNDTISMKLYIGYGTAAGDFVYTSAPVPFDVLKPQ
jgi:hypothetical protein